MPILPKPLRGLFLVLLLSSAPRLTAQPAPAFIPVTEATLGFLITVEGKVTQAVEKDLPYGYKLFIDDGSGAAQIYLNKSTDIDPKSPLFHVGSRIRVTGFGNQYNSTYEVDPRSQRDLQKAP
jgi:DNA/RNA endonuclease YhcR with UshA esterase domain